MRQKTIIKESINKLNKHGYTGVNEDFRYINELIEELLVEKDTFVAFYRLYTEVIGDADVFWNHRFMEGLPTDWRCNIKMRDLIDEIMDIMDDRAPDTKRIVVLHSGSDKCNDLIDRAEPVDEILHVPFFNKKNNLHDFTRILDVDDLFFVAGEKVQPQARKAWKSQMLRLNTHLFTDDIVYVGATGNEQPYVLRTLEQLNGTVVYPFSGNDSIEYNLPNPLRSAFKHNELATIYKNAPDFWKRLQFWLGDAILKGDMTMGELSKIYATRVYDSKGMEHIIEMVRQR